MSPSKFALALPLVLAAAATPAGASTTYFSHNAAVQTNERYGHDCFWAPPKGTDYGDLPGALPIQRPNLYPDVGSTYFVAQYVLPEGASLTFHGRYPYERYFSWTMFKPVGGGQIGPGDHMKDADIAPDKGSINPFRPGANRYGGPRNYTLHIVSGPIPATRAPNTVYTGVTDPNQRLGMSMRNYLADRGKDGTGGVGLPKLTLNLADGSTLEGTAACDALQPIKDPSTSTFPPDAYKQLIASSADPTNAPAANPPHWERFWNAQYSLVGVFMDDQAKREATYPADDNGGFQSNPDTRYLATFVSLKHGPVITVTGKMPTFPASLPASRRWSPASYQVRYWSVCTGSAPVSGLGYDCVYDQQVPLRGDRRYTMVISRAKDRPRNATPKCGYRWLSFGPGENYDDPAARPWVDLLYMRFMAPNPTWAQAPQKMTKPNTEAQFMGAYYPRSAYTTKAAFEKRGCKR